MSTWVSRPVLCPRCNMEFETELADGLHITRLPEVRRRLKEGTLHHIACPECAVVIVIDKAMIYTDFERFHWVEVTEREALSKWRSEEKRAISTYERAICRSAPPAIRGLDAQFLVRLVFSIHGLREKVLIWDAGLNDGVVECIKLEAIRQRPDLLPAGHHLWVTAVDEASGDLEFSVFDGEAVTMAITLKGAAIAQYHAGHEGYRERFPEFFQRGFVGIDRLLIPGDA